MHFDDRQPERIERQVDRAKATHRDVLIHGRAAAARFDSVGDEHVTVVREAADEVGHELVRPVLEHVLDQHEVRPRKYIVQHIQALEADAVGAVEPVVIGNERRHDVDAEVVDAGPVDEAGRLPVPTTDVDNAADVPRSHVFLKECSIGGRVERMGPGA